MNTFTDNDMMRGFVVDNIYQFYEWVVFFIPDSNGIRKPYYAHVSVGVEGFFTDSLFSVT